MGKRDKFKEKTPSYKRELKQLEDRSIKRDPLIVISFKDFDRTQGEPFSDWENDKLLALALETLHAVTSLTVGQALHQQVIKMYTKVDFPPDSGFKHPKHVPDDISWCTMHIKGKECIIGYFESNIFHIVFLDKNHAFWRTKKKNT